MAKKHQTVTILPVRLKEDLESLNLSKIKFDRSVQLLSKLKSNSYKQHGNYTTLVRMPKTYLDKLLTKKYNLVLEPLIEAGIISRNNFFSKERGICKEYGIAKKYYYKNKEVIEENIWEYGVDMCIIAYTCPLFLKPFETQTVTSWVREDLKTLKFDLKKLTILAKNRVSKISILDFKINSQIQDEYVQVTVFRNGSVVKYWAEVAKLLEQGELEGLTLIQDKRKVYLMEVEDFITMKKTTLSVYYQDALMRLEKGIWFASRNKTNFRLDSNITNMCNVLVEQIVEDNDLCQIDLMNSQFTILSNILPKDLVHPSTEIFKQLSMSGELYTYIMDKLSLEDRGVAKKVTFELLFSSHKNKSTLLAQLKEVFPEVLEYIKNYKVVYGDKEFSIMLQKFESDLFVDTVWSQVKKLGLFCLTKHDSIICKKEDSKIVQEILTKCFEERSFEGRLATT